MQNPNDKCRGPFKKGEMLHAYLNIQMLNINVKFQSWYKQQNAALEKFIILFSVKYNYLQSVYRHTG